MSAELEIEVRGILLEGDPDELIEVPVAGVLRGGRMTPSEPKLYRVKIVGAPHPHRGAEGTADPSRTVAGGQMIRVTFDEDRRGVEACYAAPHELKRL